MSKKTLINGREKRLNGTNGVMNTCRGASFFKTIMAGVFVLCLIAGGWTMADETVYQFIVKDRKDVIVPLANYKGKVLLIVNTATRCGFTPQYKELEAMYERLHDKGLEILDFPCNQFGQQAPGTAEEIYTFCQLNYKTAFPQFAKIDVNGPKADPLFKFLVSHTTFKGFPQMPKSLRFLKRCSAKRIPTTPRNQTSNGISQSSSLGVTARLSPVSSRPPQ